MGGGGKYVGVLGNGNKMGMFNRVVCILAEGGIGIIIIIFSSSPWCGGSGGQLRYVTNWWAELIN